MLITKNIKILNNYLKYHKISFGYFEFFNKKSYLCYINDLNHKKYYIEQDKIEQEKSDYSIYNVFMNEHTTTKPLNKKNNDKIIKSILDNLIRLEKPLENYKIKYSYYYHDKDIDKINFYFYRKLINKYKKFSLDIDTLKNLSDLNSIFVIILKNSSDMGHISDNNENIEYNEKILTFDDKKKKIRNNLMNKGYI